MSLWNTLAIAVRALRRNGMRTALTALGMIIGVAAVIVMVAIGTGRADRQPGGGAVGAVRRALPHGGVAGGAAGAVAGLADARLLPTVEAF